MIENYVKQLIANQEEECKWNDKLLSPLGYEEWEKVLLERSSKLRSFYATNEDNIAKIRELYKGDVTKEVADELFNVAKTLSQSGRRDPIFLAELCAPIIKYYTEHSEVAENEEKAIIVIAIRNICIIDTYMRMHSKYGIDLVRDSYLWVVSRGEKYGNYQLKSARLNIFQAYANLMILLTEMDSDDQDILAFDYLKKMKALAKAPAVTGFGEDLPVVSGIVSEVGLSIPLSIDFRTHDKKEIYDKIIESYEEICREKADSKEAADLYYVKMLETRISQHKGELSPEEALMKLEALALSLPKPDWQDSAVDPTFFLQFTYIYTLCMQILSNNDFTYEFSEREIRKLFDKFKEIVEGLPFEYLSAYVDDVFGSVLTNTMPNLQSIELTEELINVLLMRRQPSTFIHSKMVEKIAIIVAEKILEKEPEIFCGLPGFESRAEVLEKKDELLTMISRGATLHDVGKCQIAPIINQQSRRLNDEEFACIKEHPLKGEKIIKYNASFDPYLDIIKGHHKSYDGKSGYPTDFDNTRSPYKILIDLVAICDSADAATDITGRNYTTGKDFNSLLSELVEGSGTRYNPDIVRIIKDSPDVIEKLVKLTGKDRIVHSYNAYRKCLGYR